MDCSLVTASFSYYINVVNFNTQWEVIVNGVSQETYSAGVSNCTYVNSPNMIHSQLELTQNITVVVHGSETDALTGLSASESDSWSLEVNMLA
jgi:hypothetical protein